MALMLDARIAVTLAPAGPDQRRALRIVAEGATAFDTDAATTHPAGCACCAVRGPLARALDHLFLARVRGELPFFRAMTIACADAGAEEVARRTIAIDPVVSTRFRLVADAPRG
jgi:hypothetical protein